MYINYMVYKKFNAAKITFIKMIVKEKNIIFASNHFIIFH